MGGFANYAGDIQQKAFTLDQAKGAVGVGASYNITDQLLGRLDLTYAHVGADDKKNINKPALLARNLNFTSRVYEISLLGEYNIFNLNQQKFSPYVFLGIGLFHFSPYTYDAQGQKIFLSSLNTEGQGILPGRKEYALNQVNIPLGAGIKYALSDDVHVGFELGLRVLKTDYLDDVSATYVERGTLLAARGQLAVDYAFRGDELKDVPRYYPQEGTLRGNSKVNDYYYFGLFRIDFLMNWFDKNGTSGGNRGSRRGLGCPSKF